MKQKKSLTIKKTGIAVTAVISLVAAGIMTLIARPDQDVSTIGKRWKQNKEAIDVQLRNNE